MIAISLYTMIKLILGGVAVFLIVNYLLKPWEN